MPCVICLLKGGYGCYGVRKTVSQHQWVSYCYHNNESTQNMWNFTPSLILAIACFSLCISFCEGWISFYYWLWVIIHWNVTFFRHLCALQRGLLEICGFATSLVLRPPYWKKGCEELSCCISGTSNLIGNCIWHYL